jgi:threonine/homoserine/homoserine lactone efflux protein
MAIILYTKYLIAGILVSLSGSLPLGNLNVTAMLIAAERNVRKALWFAAGVTIIEVAYLRATLLLLDSVTRHAGIFFWFRVFNIVFMVCLAIGSLIMTRKNNDAGKKRENRSGGIWLGMIMSACNPMQVPFWMGWSIYLLSASLLVNSAAAYNIFSTGAGIGTFCALGIFIMAGARFSAFMQLHQRMVHIFTAVLFLLMALVQVVKLL